MPTYAEISARLLRDAAGFFRTIGEQNPPLGAQMADNATIFDQVALLIESDPTGVSPRDPGASHGQIAATLLRDAAGFFRTVGEQNKPLAVQMNENAAVFDQIADSVQQDPLGVLEAD